MFDFAKNLIKSRIKRRTIKLLLPVLLPVLVLGIIAMFIMGVVFYVTPEGSLYAKPTVTEEDQELQEKYVELADKYNKIDRWIVPGESSEDDLWYDKVNSDKDDYDNYHNIKNRELMDHYGKDIPLLETFGQIHAASVFQMMTYHLDMEDITDEFREKTASDFKPYLYYKPSSITVSCTSEEGETSTTRTPIYLLVESNTLSGHRLYHYEWTTRDSGR